MIFHRSTSSLLLLGFLLWAAGCRSSETYLSRGNKLFDEGKFEEADLEYRKALQEKTNDPKIAYRRALVSLELKRVFDAYSLLSFVARQDPSNTDAAVRFADLSLILYSADPLRSKTYYDSVVTVSDKLLASGATQFDGLRLQASVRLIDRKYQGAVQGFEQALRIRPDHPQACIGLVQALLGLESNQAAVNTANGCLAKNPRFASLYEVLYRHHMDTGQPAEAARVLQRRFSANPGDQGPQLSLARHYLRQKDRASADAALKTLLDRPRDFPNARLGVGDVYLEAGLTNEAMAQFQACESAPVPLGVECRKRIARLHLGARQNEKAVAVLDAALKQAPKDRELIIARAEIRLLAGTAEELDRAVKDLKEGATGDANAHLLIGTANQMRGQDAQARQEYSAALRANPAFQPARIAAAALEINSGDYAQALKLANEGLTVSPDDAQLLLVRAAALIRSGAFEEARNDLRVLRKRYPNSPEVIAQMGTLAIGARQYAEAERIFGELRKASPNDFRALAGQAEVLLKTGRADQALQFIGRNLGSTPDSLRVRGLLAETADRGGKLELAATEYRALAQDRPSDPQLHMRLAEVLLRAGRFKEASVVLAKLGELTPQDPKAATLHGFALEQEGRNPEAMAQYERALKIKADQPDACNNLAYLIAESGGDLDRAMKLAQTALKSGGNRPEYQDTVGWIYLKKNMLPGAMQILGNLANSHRDNVSFRYHYGAALARSGDQAGAKRELTAALGLKPSARMSDEIKRLLAAQ